MIRDSEFENDTLLGFIKTDSVGRNQNLQSVISGLNSLQKQLCMSIDASWGSGKTVFVKQIELLNAMTAEQLDVMPFTNLSRVTVDDFQAKYVVMYYNAWKNDFHKDPLQSLLFSLIDHFYTEKNHLDDKVKEITDSALKSITLEAVKKLTGGIINIEKIGDVKTIKDLVSSIDSVNERKDAVTKLISQILPEGKKLLFIIDELDRCNPEFAVRMLESIKHYYSSDSVVFLLATNNRQLANTVKKYYGEGFDGYSYLDKMYDLIIDLPPVDMEQFFRSQLRVPQNGNWINMTPLWISQHLKLSMREVNRFYSLLSFVKDSLSGGYGTHDDILAATHFFLIPLAIALKIQNINLYDDFISGKSETLIRDLVAFEERFGYMVTRASRDEQINPADKAVQIYKEVINYKKMQGDSFNHTIDGAGKMFERVQSTIGSIGQIDSPSENRETK